MSYFLGIDGGGSKTTCVVGDEFSVIATVTAGPSNITRVGEEGAREALQKAIAEACAAARITPREVERACIGIAGAGRPGVALTVRKIAQEMIAGEIEVAGDMPIALEAAFGGGSGVVVVAGTGSFAYGRNPEGRTARAGGWGFAVSDEGSAHWIGRAAVREFFRAIDWGTIDGAAEGSRLFREIAEAWELKALDELVRMANSSPNFEALFPAVLAAADGGDAVAIGALVCAGGELAQLAGTVTRQLFAMKNDRKAKPEVAVGGGVFRHSPIVRNVFCGEIEKLGEALAVKPGILEPVVGALQIARQAKKNR